MHVHDYYTISTTILISICISINKLVLVLVLLLVVALVFIGMHYPHPSVNIPPLGQFNFGAKAGFSYHRGVWGAGG